MCSGSLEKQTIKTVRPETKPASQPASQHMRHTYKIYTLYRARYVWRVCVYFLLLRLVYFLYDLLINVRMRFAMHARKPNIMPMNKSRIMLEMLTLHTIAGKQAGRLANRQVSTASKRNVFHSTFFAFMLCCVYVFVLSWSRSSNGPNREMLFQRYA